MRQRAEHHCVPIDGGVARHDAKQRDLPAVKHVRQNVGQRFRVAGHFQCDIEAFFHPELVHRICHFLSPHIQCEISAHFSREIQPVRIYVGDDNVARAGTFADWNGHATDRPRAGYEHIFANQIE